MFHAFSCVFHDIAQVLNDSYTMFQRFLPCLTDFEVKVRLLRIVQALLAAKRSSVDEAMARKVAQSRPKEWLRGIVRPLERLLRSLKPF